MQMAFGVNCAQAAQARILAQAGARGPSQKGMRAGKGHPELEAPQEPPDGLFQVQRWSILEHPAGLGLALSRFKRTTRTSSSARTCVLPSPLSSSDPASARDCVTPPSVMSLTRAIMADRTPVVPPALGDETGGVATPRRLTFHRGQMIAHAIISQTLVPPLLSSSLCRPAEKNQNRHGNCAWSSRAVGPGLYQCMAVLVLRGTICLLWIL